MFHKGSQNHQFEIYNEKCTKDMVQTFLNNAMMKMDASSASVYNKCGNINHVLTNGNTLLDEILICWLYGAYKTVFNLFDFIERINRLINIGARFTDELNIQIQQDIAKEISDFIEPIGDSKCTIVGYQKENVIFTSIRNARLKIGKLLESEFCRNNCLFNSHFNINGNKGYAQKCNNGMRNYVIYRGCITMRASWSVVSSDKNSSRIIKKESISVHIKDDGTIEVSKQDSLRYKNGEIDFNGCCVLIGGIPLKDALEKGRWLYSNNQTFYDSGYYSREVSPERKTSMFDSNNDFVKLDTCKINQESNENLSTSTDTKQSQYVGSPDGLSINTSNLSSAMGLCDEVKKNIAKIGQEKKVEEEDSKMEENDRENFPQGIEHAIIGRKDAYKTVYVSCDNSQISLEHSDQNNNVTASNIGNLNNQYCEDMDIKVLATIGNASNSQDRVAEWLSNQPNNNVCSRKDSSNTATSNTIPNPSESGRSSVNSLSWDNNALDLNDNDIELDYNPPRRTRSFNSKHRSNSVPTRLVTLREDPDNSQKNYNLNESFVKPTITATRPKAEHDISAELDTLHEIPDNNPCYNLNESCIYSIVRDPGKNVKKFGIYYISNIKCRC
ncbi:MAG: hypothetical protein sL5_00110 [Candidatus Mesenet longicola]|uniref:Uncharacterized protein n=1 Tax=Candidatus Mesenet longicola TaxID=1892558 RepID=A0A8J3HRL3_9RICK|nr:MAG: hypothetical protein sGL2_00640 [Candidatus Mesenet longicola]GHM59018.1 MAG: hypothetical protein sL5_00110 [Candidatus Mesenet longicola]